MDHIWRGTHYQGHKIYVNKVCLKIIQKALQQPLQHAIFFNFFRGSMPRTPLKPFLFRNQLQISSAL